MPLDALFVCTPPAHHAAPAIAAFERGLAVYLEKPLARTLRRRRGDRRRPGGRAARSAPSATSGARWTCSTSCARCCAAPSRACSSAAASGRPRRARRDLEQAAPGSPTRRASGGLLFELASHDIDLQIALAGPVESVQATAGSGLLALAGRPAERARRRRLGAPRASPAAASAPRTSPGAPLQSPPLYALDVQRRTSRCSSRSIRSSSCAAAPRGEEVAVTGAVQPRVSSVTRFLEAARSGDPAAVPCSPADALATLRALLACERAIASGERVAV